MVRYYHSPDLLSLVEQATRVCQNNEETVAYMKMNALLLLQLLNGQEVADAVQDADKQLLALESDPASRGSHGIHQVRLKTKQTVDRLALDVTEATLSFAQSCPLPGSYPSALHALLKCPDDFQAAILATLRAGGDNAGRAAMLGTWLGAHLGMEGIPERWRAKLTNKDRISKAAGAIVAQARQYW
ncbi:MAG: ADP-ribosylglycohydrolase family protein [Verrucomicrobia bacterium]|nr:ADP-ribosylglycohydrolase family protein [Verrucomicrobiota bacterium]